MLARLVDLDVAFTNIEVNGLPSLPALTHLNLRDTRLSDQTLASLPQLPSLETLDIAAVMPGQSTITGAGLSQLTPQKFPKLKDVYLYSASISEDDVTQLKSKFPGLSVYH